MRKRWEFQVERVVPATPVVVWEAFGNPGKLMRWFCLDGHIEMREGGSFEFRHGPSDEEVERGKVIAIQPPSKFVYQSGSEAEPTVMEFRLSEEGAGTKVTMVHSGFCDANINLDEYLKGSIMGSHFCLGNLELFLRENYSYQDYPYLGVRTEPTPEGALVKKVTLPWAAEAGLQPGDVITALGDYSLVNASGLAFWEASRAQKANQPVTVRGLRGGQPFTAVVTPGGWRETKAIRSA